ncbi:MAG: 50S ribosomal protein L9 [Oscillospiraceae bacterium]|nr:50S ribosomal protein L9 [Oscillospiraceae bacterium]
MKVILKQDVKGLGKAEDMVDVSDGYARNFLLPRGMAVTATSDNLNVMKTRKQAEQSKRDRELEKAVGFEGRLSGIVLKVPVKAGENGRLFGSITTQEISERLSGDHSIEVDRKKIVIKEPIRNTGEHEVEVRLHQGVKVTLRLLVTPMQ